MTAVCRSEFGIVSCRICSAPMHSRLDLGHHPLADRFLTKADLDEPETRYPLRIGQCDSCKYVGLMHVVPAEQRYTTGEYSYTAGNSKVSREHFADLALFCGMGGYLQPASLVVDIGGNDGTFLNEIRASSRCNVLNVDPSSAATLGERNFQIPTLPVFWDRKAAASTMARVGGGADLIVCTNVLNHADIPTEFVANIRHALAPEGRVVIEVPSFHELVHRCAWDTMYLEHVSYFSVTSMQRLLEGAGLRMIECQYIDYMGGSMRCVAVHASAQASPKSAIDLRGANEVSGGVFGEASWSSLARDVDHRRATLREKLGAVRTLGGRVIGIGAAAKGNTLLNACGITKRDLIAIADASPHKVGKFTPGSHIPIIADEDIPADVTHAIILPWNLSTFLREKLGARFQILEV